jgi:hypothetical protein
MGGSGICEAVLVSLALLLWLYSFYRLYSAWQRVLNFSEASIQGPQGWDLLVNWIMERIQVLDDSKASKASHFSVYCQF